jgi:hypothetical protein
MSNHQILFISYYSEILPQLLFPLLLIFLLPAPKNEVKNKQTTTKKNPTHMVLNYFSILPPRNLVKAEICFHQGIAY